MLDFASDTPSACPPHSVLIALQGGGSVRATRIADSAAAFAAARNEDGGFHVGRGTLVRVNGGEPLTWETFASENAALGRDELRAIFAALSGSGFHMDASATFTVAVVPAPPAPAVTDARLAAEADLARLDAAFCQFREARRRYSTDTACNAWCLEQVALDVAHAAQTVARSFAARAELA